MRSVRSWTHTVTHCMIPFTWNVQNRQIHRDGWFSGAGSGRNGEWLGFPLEVTKILSNWIQVIVAQHFECTKYHWIIFFKMVTFKLCELYLNFLKYTWNSFLVPCISTPQFKGLTPLSRPKTQGRAFIPMQRSPESLGAHLPASPKQGCLHCTWQGCCFQVKPKVRVVWSRQVQGHFQVVSLVFPLA